MELDCFVMFSSGTSVWGSKGLAHHGAANQFLDAMAYYRRTQGLAGMSINWGWWAESNFTAEGEAFLAAVGLAPMATDQAIHLLEYFMGVGAIQKSVAAIDWRIFKPLYEVRRERPFLAQMEATVPVEEAQPAEALSQLLDRLDQARPHERRELLQGFVQAEAARVLGFERNRQPDLREGLFQMGMDSLMAVELKSRLENGVKVPLPATLTFDYPTIEALTNYLAKEILHLGEQEDLQPVAVAGKEEAVEEYAELAQLATVDVKALLDQELAAIDQLIGNTSDD
jgi:myxalamid-type polyketide synthase MxaE and MxaD